MKIKLSSMQSYRLAEEFATEIRQRVTTCHLARIGVLEKLPDSTFEDVCAAVRSMRPGSEERREFVATIRFHFKRQRTERDMPARWQDYVARVNAHRSRLAA